MLWAALALLGIGRLCFDRDWDRLTLPLVQIIAALAFAALPPDTGGRPHPRLLQVDRHCLGHGRHPLNLPRLWHKTDVVPLPTVVIPVRNGGLAFKRRPPPSTVQRPSF